MDLETYIDSDISPPASTSLNFITWKKMDGYVQACINATLHVSVAPIAIGIKTAAEIWKLLETSYLQQAFAKKSQLRSELQSISQGELSISSYCDKIKILHEQLKLVGDLVSESDLVLHCLHGLNVAFDNFVMMIENNDTPPCFATLRSKRAD